jgi:hypothetical protein
MGEGSRDASLASIDDGLDRGRPRSAVLARIGARRLEIDQPMRVRQPALVAHGLIASYTRRRPPAVRRAGLLPFLQPEAALQNQVLALARLYNWRAYHTFDSRKSPPGFPDLVLVRGKRLIFAELKTQRGRLTLDQSAWLEDLRATCAEVYVWRPADLPIVAAVLRRRS